MPSLLSPTARVRTGALLASAAALLSAGLLQPATAAAASSPATDAAHATAAVLDLDGTGRTPVIHGEDRAYDTASIVKVDILAALLLQAQDAGRQLTARERALAEPMIRRSDNAAAGTLWRQIGRASGLAAANRRLGLTATTGGPGVRWGLTRTTASDQVRLLRNIFDAGGPAPTALDADSRAYVRTLMSQVLPEQSWGVSAAGAEGAGRILKNGWLERTTTGRWDVNSVGEVTVGGHRCLVAVLTDGSASMSDGVSLVERTARAAVA
ncbi:serine hydrolase [Streptomyces sp. NPDC006184]|uniref:serine hydrolase n=1 Tax=unclassified Streptomyces TaxID=2593676 RepID=UPI0033A0AFC2